jgi:pseudouridine-5'-phosphate glycosidase
MKIILPSSFHLSSDVARALDQHLPVVALETTVITHGLPAPENLRLALNAETIVKEKKATPATTALLEGKVKIGLSKTEIEQLVGVADPVKVSSRNLGICIAQKRSGGTTVAGTLVICRTAGIRVFATGGIGGVHRSSSFDISADLDELARSPVIVVCAGAKAILDLSATLEVLETRGVPVIGYQTNEFPAFYSPNSGLPVDAKADSPQEIVSIARSHWALGLYSAILVCVPPPAEYALDAVMVEREIQKALSSAEEEGIKREKVTPYLLGKMKEITGGKSLQTNLALLKNNISLATDIACQLNGSSNLRNY